ncbi:MAG: glycosyltransferase family 4 protein [Acutalibacteraceae bacterium]|nr:glycosyltransferase family 4 protein [Acutalibacteraceae bacterium]
MKVLFLDAYFKPEKISGAHFAEDMRQYLANAGHTMQIYVPTPSRGVSEEVRKEYKKRKNETELNGAVSIHRFSLYKEGKNPLLRAIRYFICNIQLLWFALREKNVDIVPIGSTPPTNGIMGVIIKKIKKFPFVYIVQDMFPESLVSAGMTKEGSLLYKIGDWVSNVTYKNASHIIVISESMKASLIKKGVRKDKISVIYNWIDTENTVPVSREDNTLFDEFNLDREKFYITYAGNLGNSQNVGLVVDCAEKFKENDNIQFVIFGDGSEKEKLVGRIEESRLDNIKIFPMQPLSRVSEVYSLGDASFVICKKGVGKGAFPSKAASIMATATPIIASFDTDSDLCRILSEENCGICTQAEDVEGAVSVIEQLYNNRAALKEMGENGRKLACSKFSKETGLSKRITVYEKYALKREER